MKNRTKEEGNIKLEIMIIEKQNMTIQIWTGMEELV
jgi:hypothetical protein